MTADDLRDYAKGLSKNGWDRLSTETQGLLKTNEGIFDTHTHIFDIQTLDVWVTLRRLLGGSSELTEELIALVPDEQYSEIHYYLRGSLEEHSDLGTEAASDEEWDQLAQFFEAATEAVSASDRTEATVSISLRELLKHWRLLLSQDMEEVYRYYMDNFALTLLPAYRGKTLVVTALMMDLEAAWNMEVRRPFEQVVTELLVLGQTHPLLPYFAVDPRRVDHDLPGSEKNLYELFTMAFPTSGPSFFGVKAYPGLGYLPSDWRLDPIMKICADHNIPVLSHCGSSTIRATDTPLEVYRGEELVVLTGTPEENAVLMNDPREWEPVLKKYPHLRLNLAHFGGIEPWENFDANDPATEPQNALDTSHRIYHIVRLCETYDYVHTDFSYTFVEDDLFPKLQQQIEEHPKLTSRVVHGTDSWVVVIEENMVLGQRSFLQYFEDYQEDFLTNNPIRQMLGSPNSTKVKTS
ncbi:MAG TPA: hypothetical protein DCE41_22805 [Cytophagales bacterium]|nr:hypothetical protein [Cytophagales bacterium]HAA22888.1 hypothetical protein [Cytophagales bacterium]HAP60555.1 hypothetical protein [Cytophagales bacterium]